MSLLDGPFVWHDRPEWGFRETERVLILDAVEWIASYHVVDLGEGRLMPFFHLDIYHFSPSNLKNMLKEWKKFRQEHPDPLYTMVDVDSRANDRLREMFGFKYLMDCPCTDGKSRRMYLHIP